MRIIRGKYGRRRFDVPSTITARPTTDFARENIFNVLENIVDFEECEALDLFSGTGAISFEFLSRGCSQVTCVEKSSIQFNFIKKVKETLKDENLVMVKGDVFRFLDIASRKYDLIFADPPYDLPNFGEIPERILSSKMLKDDTIIVVEHSKNYDFSHLPHFYEHRTYGSVNFSIFKMDYIGVRDEEDDEE